jgi:hypothetical protein
MEGKQKGKPSGFPFALQLSVLFKWLSVAIVIGLMPSLILRSGAHCCRR